MTKRRIRLLRREARLVQAAHYLLEYTIALYVDDGELIDSDREAVERLRAALSPYERAGIIHRTDD